MELLTIDRGALEHEEGTPSSSPRVVQAGIFFNEGSKARPGSRVAIPVPLAEMESSPVPDGCELSASDRLARTKFAGAISSTVHLKASHPGQELSFHTTFLIPGASGPPSVLSMPWVNVGKFNGHVNTHKSFLSLHKAVAYIESSYVHFLPGRRWDLHKFASPVSGSARSETRKRALHLCPHEAIALEFLVLCPYPATDCNGLAQGLAPSM